MFIADIFADGRIKPLEETKKASGIGRDSFTRGRIAINTIKEICSSLANYQALIQEYQVDQYM